MIKKEWVGEFQATPLTLSRSLLYIFVALLAALISWYQWKRSKVDKMIEKIPGPPIWPITGNAHLFFGLDMQGVCDKMLELMNVHGSIMRFWLGPYLWINLAEPRDLEILMTSEFNTNKDPTYRFFKDQSDGLFIANGDNWKKLRKIVNPTFNQKLLEQFVETFNEQGNILVKFLESKVNEPTFDISEYVARCTVDIFCGTQMNVKSREQEENKSNFSENLKASLVIIKKRFYNLYLQPDTLFYMTDLAKQNKKHLSHIHNFVKELVQERRKARIIENETLDEVTLAEKKKRPVYLDAMLDHFGHLSDDEMVVKTTDIVIAGSDTTSVAISFALILMGTYKDIQEKVYQEVMDVVGQDEDITHFELPKFTYLDMVLKEVLRHFTVPAIVRKLDKDQSLGYVTLPAGSSVQLCIYGVHRDARYWSHPNDFYPDHFLPENVAKRPRFSYIPFSMGPRNCPGYAFAMMSMKTVVAAVVRKYKLHSDVDIKNMQYNNYFMLEPKDGYPIQISKR